MPANPHTFRKSSDRVYLVAVAATGAHLGTVRRVSPDHHRAAKWIATDPAGEQVGGNWPTRDYAAHQLADAATEREAAAVTEQPAASTEARTIQQIQREEHVGFAAAVRIQAEADPLTLHADTVADRLAAVGYRVTVAPIGPGTPPDALRITVRPHVTRTDVDNPQHLARALAAHMLRIGYDVARSEDTVTVTGPEPEDDADLHSGEVEADAPLAPPTDADGRLLPTVTVKIENTYACGHESSKTIDLPAPDKGAENTARRDDDAPWQLAEWWEETVHAHTGDGHPCGTRDHAIYEARIEAAPTRPELVGLDWTWEG